MGTIAHAKLAINTGESVPQLINSPLHTAAKSLGLTVPPTPLATANEVIE